MTPQLIDDIARLHSAVCAVRDAAKVESLALANAETDGSSVTLELLRSSHLSELDTIQRLVACVNLMELRYPQFVGEIEKAKARRLEC